MTEEPKPTGKAVVEFLGSAARKGDMNANTAGAMKNAVKEVLGSVHGDGWEDVDVSQIDVGRDADRFARLRGPNFKAASLKVYQSRFKNAVGMYLTWRENPADWTYRAERPYKARQKARQQKQNSDRDGAGGAVGGHKPSQPKDPGDVEMIDYPYPLRRGFLVTLRLPADLTRQEAKRLQAYIESLAFDERAALPAGSDNGGR